MEPNNRNNNNSEEKKQECIKLAILGLILVAGSSIVGGLVKFITMSLKRNSYYRIHK